jgi:hypothetical protein
MTITDDDLSRWEALCAAAAPGPLEVGAPAGTPEHAPAGTVALSTVYDDAGTQVADCFDNRAASDLQCEADARFFAAAREGWPRTLAEVRRLRVLLTATQLEHQNARDLLAFYRSCALSGEVPTVEPADVIATARAARGAR